MKHTTKSQLCTGIGTVLALAVFSTAAMAVDNSPAKSIFKKAAPNTWVDIHLGGKDNGGVGMSKKFIGNLWTGMRVDGLGSESVQASADLLYKVPKQFLIWEPYFGGGVDYDLNAAKAGSHITVGTKVLWFFAEEEFKLQGRGNTHRAGIRLSF